MRLQSSMTWMQLQSGSVTCRRGPMSMIHMSL